MATHQAIRPNDEQLYTALTAYIIEPSDIGLVHLRGDDEAEVPEELGLGLDQLLRGLLTKPPCCGAIETSRERRGLD